MMTKTQKQIEKAIASAMESISADIRMSNDTDENKLRAEAIKLLAEAYDTVHRGKNAHEF